VVFSAAMLIGSVIVGKRGKRSKIKYTAWE
jgi:hypothetical protein